MANLLTAQEVDGGIIFDDGAGVFHDTFDPSVSGFGALEGSLFLRSTGQIYRKTGAADTNWTLMDTASAPNLFLEIAADSGANSIADSATDILTIAGGIGVETLSLPGSDQITITANKLRSVSFIVENPTASDKQILQHKFGEAVKLTRVSASTDVGTVTLQFDERPEGLPNTPGADVMSSVLVADTDTAATSAFVNSGIATENVLNLDIDALTGVPTTVRIHVEFELA